MKSNKAWFGFLIYVVTSNSYALEIVDTVLGVGFSSYSYREFLAGKKNIDNKYFMQNKKHKNKTPMGIHRHIKFEKIKLKRLRNHSIKYSENS